MYQQKYFVFKTNNAWESWEDKVLLEDSTNIEAVLKSLESGKNLFEILPELKSAKDKFYFGEPFYLAYFEKTDSANPQQIGKLLIPHYLVKTKSQIENELVVSDSEKLEEIYRKLIEKFPDTDQFYCEWYLNYKKLDQKEVLVLKKDQIIL